MAARIPEEMKSMIRDMITQGMTIARISEETGVHESTIKKIRVENCPVNNKRSKIFFNRVNANLVESVNNLKPLKTAEGKLRPEDVPAIKLEIEAQMVSGDWGPWAITELARKHKTTEHQMREVAIVVAANLRCTLNPHALAAVVMGQIDLLRELAAECRDQGNLGLAVSATERAGALAASVLRAGMLSRALGQTAARDEAAIAARMIRGGWRPPSVDGLPELEEVDDD